MRVKTPEETGRASEDADHDDVVVRCPATGAVVGTVPVATRHDVEAVAARLRKAQPAWQSIGVKGRAAWMATWRDWMIDHTDDVLTVLQMETGKSWGDTGVEIVADQIINYWIDYAADFLKDESVRPFGATNVTKNLTIAYEPYPLVGVITPWNGPLSIPLLDIPAALMAGCAVLSKPSEIAPLAWQSVVKGWKDIGAPDVLDTVNGFGDTGAALVDVVDYVMFTGSTATGRRIAARAGERLIPCDLELGGKDAMIVCADADIDRAVDGAIWGGFVYSGQVCISVERLYVEEHVYDEFLTKLVAKTSQLRQGMDVAHDYSSDISAMTTEQQLNTVSRHVDEAVSQGAKVLTGGKRSTVDGTGFFYEPTVLVDVDHDMRCMREETFGPTLPVMKVSSAAEAIEKANDSPYGLAGSVWTRDKAKGMALARQLNTGTVSINNLLDGIMQFPLPMAGWNDSGLGSRSGGRHGIQKYCRPKSIVSEKLSMKKDPFWYPYGPRKGKALSAMGRFLVARDWRRRLGR